MPNQTRCASCYTAQRKALIALIDELRGHSYGNHTPRFDVARCVCAGCKRKWVVRIEAEAA
jgi:hypothetical protein